MEEREGIGGRAATHPEGEMVRKLPLPPRNRAPEVGEAKKGRDGFIKLNVSSPDKAFPRSRP